MRIILQGLGMSSQPMDIPENSGYRWDIVLTQPLQVATNKTPEYPAFITRCSFEWNGKTTFNGEKIYTLTNISKL